MNGNTNPQDLGVKAEDKVGVGEIFGKMQGKMAGIGGTLHITEETALATVPELAWKLSQQTQKPVVIVVKAR